MWSSTAARSSCANLRFSPQIFEPSGELDPVQEISAEIAAYAREKLLHTSVGQDEYFATQALLQAAQALREGNYGIGAVAVLADKETIRAFNGRNALVRGNPELRETFGAVADPLTSLVGHAEAVAILRSRLTMEADDEFLRDQNEHLANFPEGVSVYGTLEPCPMCTSIITNDRRIVRSVSNALDPVGAYAINDREAKQPPVWGWIQQARNLRFELLQSTDPQLADLSNRVFLSTREAIDKLLASGE